MNQLELFVTADAMVSHGTPSDFPRSKCFNCDWTGRTGEAIYGGTFDDLITERKPSGRCPKCDCFVYQQEDGC